MIFFEHERGKFICPICKNIISENDKCFIMIRKRNNISVSRKNMICKSTQCCNNCYDKIENFIMEMEK